jgi:membrane protein implicated in regulation of membrane protease activity
VPGILISSRYTVKVPDLTIRGGLAGILIISGLKLLNVPQANWVLGGGLVAITVVLTIYTVRVMLNEAHAAREPEHEPRRATPERA